VVVVEAELALAEGTALVRPGTAVVASGRVGQRGRARVSLVGPVEATGAIDAAQLGQRLARDVEIHHGGVAAGTAYEGALVRVLADRAPRGQRWVESVGDVTARFVVPADALTAAPREFVFRAPPAHRFVTPFEATKLYRTAESIDTTAPPVGTIAPGVEVVLLEQRDALARVRAHGPVEIEGWAIGRRFADRGERAAEGQLLKPTHEVFLGCRLYATPTGATPIAALRGGALVEINGRANGRVKVTTTEGVIATGYVDEAELRALTKDDAAGPAS
jgi:hypothetical protein